MNGVTLKAGLSIGRYQMVRFIGQGAMGTVFEARDSALGRRVALKVWNMPVMDDALAERATQRFFREGRAAARVRHPHIVDVYDVGVEDGRPFLVLEFVEGESLAQLLSRNGKISVERAVEILLPILSAVAELHAAGITHRDIKPGNILLVRGETCAKLADFGVSRFDDGSPSITRPDAVIGTPEYMAPEVLQGRAHATECTDQYALGVTLYECVTGGKPFSGSTEYALMDAAIRAAIQPPSERDPSLPRALDRVVLRAMHADPAQRYPSIDDLAAALLPFASPAILTRWRNEFSHPGMRFEWESDARAAAERPRPRWHTHGIRSMLAAGAVAAILVSATVVAPTAVSAVKHTSASAQAPRPLAVASPAPPEPTPAVADDSADPAQAPRPERLAPRPTPPAVRQQAVSVGSFQSSARSSAAAAPPPATRGDNAAPIIDVP